MFTEKEEAFLKYWESNRERLGNLKYQIVTGLPFALLIGGLYWGFIQLMFFFGWFARDEMAFNALSSSWVILLAIIIFGIFFSVYSKKFRWEKNDGFYQALLKKKNNITNRQ